LLGTAVAGVATSGDKDASPKNWFGGFFNNLIQEDTPETETENQEGGAVVTPDSSSKYRIASTPIAVEDYDEYGISPLAESAYTLKVTTDPSDAVDTFSWSSSNNSAITLSPSSNGKSCTVTCNSAFDSQIIITATSNDNSDISATCSVDYVKRVQSVNITVDTGSIRFSTSTSTTYTHNVSATPVFSAGTITPDFVVSSYSLASNLGTIMLESSKTRISTNGVFTTSTPYDFFVLGKAVNSAYNNNFKNAITNTTSDGTLSVTYTSSYNGTSYSSGTASTGVAFEVIGVSATGVSISDGSLVF
jgi:hypothetical protein